MPDRTTPYLIWSHEHRAYWKAARHGYTNNLLEAGLYDAAEAQQICQDACWAWNRGTQDIAPPEVMVPLPDQFATRGIAEVLAELQQSIDAATAAKIAARDGSVTP